MNGNLELLNFIHQNSEMGTDTLEQLLEKVEDENFKNVLESQFEEYGKIYSESEKMINDRDRHAKGITPFTKAFSRFMINMKTMRDKSPSHISEMLIQGSTMGIIDVNKKMNRYGDADKNILKLGKRLHEFEEHNVDELKKFLH